MVYLTRYRLNESVTVGDLPTMNTHIDEKIIPALEGVQGVRAAHVYECSARELVLIINIENAATIDRFLASRDVDKAVEPFTQWAVRIGSPELMFDRPRQNVNAAMTLN